jgi:RND family efflux transporter MFP subunit
MEPQHIPAARPVRKRTPWVVGLCLSAGFVGLFVVGLLPRLHREAELASAAAAVQHERPTVTVAVARPAPAETQLDLPGEMKAYQEAAVFARANGYLKRRLVDIGDRVRAGQLIAEIESPELEREIAQARAALEQAQANLTQVRTDAALAKTTAQRWQSLRRDGSVSQQDADEKQAAFLSQTARTASMEAAVRAARSNVSRLETLARFQRVEAPFAGTITARGADPGALIGNGAAGASLFKLVQLDRLRVDVAVPQPYAPTIRQGQAVQVAVSELGQAFPGRVTRTAGALDPATRTLLVQVELANDGRLMPGMYARVKLTGKRAVTGVQVPGNAIVPRGKGMLVAVVDKAGVVRFRQVQTGADDGATVEIASGVQAGEQVVLGVSDDIQDGVQVRAVPAAEE